MADYRVITIKVRFDEKHPTPSDDYLKETVSSCVKAGLFDDPSDRSVVEEWSVDIEHPASVEQ